jgi:predicted MFS family arabinose efflux permease
VNGPLVRFYLFRGLGLTWLYVPFQWFYLRSHGLSATELMTLNTVFCVAAVLLEVPTGALADRLGRRPVLTAGALVSALSCLVFVACPSSFGWLALANGLAALSMTCISGADSAFLFDFLGWGGRGETYQRAETLSSAIKLGTTAVGGLAGWALVAREHDLSMLYTITALLGCAAALLALSLPEPWRKDRQQRRSGRRASERLSATAPRSALRDLVGHGARASALVWNRRDLLWLMVLSAALFPVLRVGIFLDQPFVELLGYSTSSLGLVFAAKDLVAAVAAGLTAVLLARLGEPRLLTVLPLVTLVALVGMMFADAPAGVALVLLPTFAFGVYTPLVRIFVNGRLEGCRDRATVLSTEGMARRFGFAIFSPLVGAAVDAWSLSSALALSGAWAGIALVLVIVLPFHGDRARALSSKDSKDFSWASRVRSS